MSPFIFGQDVRVKPETGARPGQHEPGQDEPGHCGPARRPLRRDAERNRQRILQAAAEVFTERGLEVSLDEVARQAGVGIGTVYRRFPTKEDLIEALFISRIEDVAALAEQATDAADPWTGLVTFMLSAAEMMADNRGLRQMMMYSSYGRDKVWYARQRNAPLVTKLVRRAQAAGQLRADLEPTDIPFIVFVLTDAAQFARRARPDIYRRYLTLMLDGLRPERPDVTPLPVPALSPEEFADTMRQDPPRGH
jgi:AcrR family transcriptional regulator